MAEEDCGSEGQLYGGDYATTVPLKDAVSPPDKDGSNEQQSLEKVDDKKSGQEKEPSDSLSGFDGSYEDTGMFGDLDEMNHDELPDIDDLDEAAQKLLEDDNDLCAVCQQEPRLAKQSFGNKCQTDVRAAAKDAKNQGVAAEAAFKN